MAETVKHSKARIYTFPVLFLSLALCTLSEAQDKSYWKADENLLRQISDSRIVHSIMKEIPENSGMYRWEKKEVHGRRMLPLFEDFSSLQHNGEGRIYPDAEFSHSGKGSVKLVTPVSGPVKSSDNRNYGMPEIVRPLGGEDLRGYNRVSCWVYVEATGFYTAFLGFELRNEGEHPTPTPGRFEGSHFVTVTPGQWIRIIWEIPDLYRDKVTGFSVSIMMNGETQGSLSEMTLWVDEMSIESVSPEHSRGFGLDEGSVAYSHSGYLSKGRKQAVLPGPKAQNFSLVDEKGSIVYSSRTVPVWGKDFSVADFSDFTSEGTYTLKVGSSSTRPFPIGGSAFLSTAWHTLNFYFSQRCGFDQNGIHEPCHLDVLMHHPLDGRTLSVAGGWHDAADLTQGTGNTTECIISLLEMASAVKGRDEVLYERLLEEARWGLSWVLRTRFGDGYRLGGIIIGIWTKNTRGDKDDMDCNATNNASDNFRTAGACAMAVEHFMKADPVFAGWLERAAKEDYVFAKEALPSQINPSSEAELNAMAVVSAMRLYDLTGDESYLEDAASWAKSQMKCQQMSPRNDWKIPLRGFYWENHSHQRALAYYHGSQEHLLVQGLAMLLEAAPSHKDSPLWKESLQAYAEYYKAIVGITAPYGMLPAGVYEKGNTDYSTIYHEGNAVGLPTMEEYNAQVGNGVPLGGGFYLRRFPVSYQFRGFNSVTLAKGKAAFILSRALSDPVLRDIGTRQVEWVIGLNPFAMSTVYGEGYDYPLLYGAYSGNVVGAVPVGIETFENDDEPYFPMQSNCTYKEIWTQATARLSSCVAEIFLLKH